MSGRAAASPSWSTSRLLPKNAFGYVPTPALVAPIEFTLRLDDYAALGGHVDEVRPLERGRSRSTRERADQRVRRRRRRAPARDGVSGARKSRRLADGRRHLHDGPIDLIIEAFGARASVAPPTPPPPRASRRSSTSSARNCRCLRAGPPVRRAAGRRRAAHGERGRAVRAPSASSRRWRRSPARSPRRFSPR